MTSVTQGITAAALAVLPLPDLDRVTSDQTRGADCLWCAVRLTSETAIDLGERQGDGTHWFPRACRDCVLPQAMDALQLHTGSCEQCPNDHTGCETGLGLVRLVREACR